MKLKKETRYIEIPLCIAYTLIFIVLFSAEEFDKISGGTMAADKKKLSLSKDIAGAIDLDSDEWDDLYDRAWNLRGKLVRGADGTISYISNSASCAC